MKPRDVGLAILLTALALVIPLAFTFLRVVIPPFTATLASHVPSMLAVYISPAVAVLVGVGSTLGFLVATGPVIAARAATHIVWGYMGAVLYRRGWPAWAALLAAVVPHALGEALVVVPFGYDLYRAGVVVGVGTLLHHLVDMGITLGVVALLQKARVPLTAGRP